MGWFGRKASLLKESETPQVNLEDAMRSVLRAQANVTHSAGAIDVYGQEGICTIGSNRSSHTEVFEVEHMVEWLRKVVGEGYTLTVTLYGEPFGARATFMDYMDPTRYYARTPDSSGRDSFSYEEFMQWFDGTESDSYHISSWWVTARKS